MKSLISIFFLLFPCILWGQQSNRIKGSLVDTCHNPVKDASIVLMNQADSSQITWIVCKEHMFELKYKDTGKPLLLHVSAIGYAGKYIKIDPTHLNLGEIVMKPWTLNIDEVTVSVKKPIVHKVERGRDQYMIPEWMGMQAYDLSSLLALVPGLILKNDDIEIAGIGKPVYILNGLNPQMGELESLNPRDIEKVTIRTHEACIRIIDKKGPLNNPADRDHCIQYMVAIPLLFGRLTAADYEDNVAQDKRIDALREKVVTSTSVYVGAHGNLLEDKPENCKVLKVNNPILTSTDLLRIKYMNVPGFKVSTVSINYYKNTSLEKAIDRVFLEVDRAYKEGANIIILSDRDIDEYHVAIPSLLAVSAVSQYLIRTKKSTAMALILESAEPHEVHHFATLLGYGACAVNPYLAHDTIAQLIDEGLLDKDYYAAVDDYNKAVLNGIVKIASKMGISTIQSYQSSQIFEAVGISRDVIDKYFTGTVSRVGGIGLEDIQADVEAAHNAAFDPLGLDINMELADGGAHKFRSGKEEHLFTPQTIHLFQKACFTGDYKAFKDFTRTVDNMGAEGMHLRSLLDFSYDPNGGIPLEEVEPVSSIVKRFKAAAMSYGALSSEAHETIAIALNRLGGRSNTGEGGEPEERYQSESNSKIKQVASARFGVTSKYLVSAEEIQIKLAQGAKPGEGGNLPGAKVYPWIAKTRHSTTGVGLISPPPHHDIYSIEDLAELIYDLKNANRSANINVKLVSEAGVGTIAAGVAKGGAQVILVSGYDGGTGAAPRTSIKHAGLPWELGIAETHQTLILNGLRTRVRIESDSKLLSGRDVVISCMLGAEEFGFGTTLLMAEGCVMMRVCNLDTCPMGICTQNPELRKNFKGKPEYIINYLTFVAEELREYMAKLGVRTVDELVGRTDLLRVKPAAPGSRAAKLDLDCILHNPAIANSNVHFIKEDSYDFHLENTLDMKVLMKKFKLGSKAPQSVSLNVSNVDRAFGAIFGSEITRKYGNDLPDDVYTVHCNGAGGQSFGAFIPNGLTLELVGDCNDYMGKGLSGGKIIVRPPQGIDFKPEENIITGNVALYGATSGQAFISGVAGERFCVRNSGATAVVEGVGDHGCEYMTGGTVVVLGQTGKNFAAGMTGGIAYVLDENWDFYQRVNKETVSLEPVEHKYDVATLKELIRAHVEATGSPRGKEILDNFSAFLPKFKKVLPYDYDRMLRVIASVEERGLDGEQAQIEAFYAVQKHK